MKKIINIIKSPILYILVICLMVQLKFYNTAPEYVMTADSWSYSVEYHGNILKGQIDDLRTPVYPHLIKIVGLFGKDEDILFKRVVFLQKILFLITVLFVYLTMRKMTNSKIISSVVSFLVRNMSVFSIL